MKEIQKMKRALLTFLFIGASAAWASEVDFTVQLDSVTHDVDGTDYDWNYTVTAPDGLDFYLLDNFTISGAYGVDGAFVSGLASLGWNADTPVATGGGLYSVEFENKYDPGSGFTLGDFVIQSTSNVPATGGYTLSIDSFDPSVPVPGAATPEPASIGLVSGLAFLGLVGFKRFRASKA